MSLTRVRIKYLKGKRSSMRYPFMILRPPLEYLTIKKNAFYFVKFFNLDTSKRCEVCV